MRTLIELQIQYSFFNTCVKQIFFSKPLNIQKGEKRNNNVFYFWFVMYCSSLKHALKLKLCNNYSFCIVDSAPPSNLRLKDIGTKIEASWTAPSNPVVDYRVFINDENVNSNGTMVASVLTSYITNTTFSLGTTITLHVRATSNHYWSTVVSSSITIYGNFNVQ